MLAKKLLGAAAAAEPVYIEDVFSTYLYTGNGSTQTITNGIDLAGEGGLVWTKRRNTTGLHNLVDTVRGSNKNLVSSLTSGESTEARLTGFTSTGFSLSSLSEVNANGGTYASWTFRKAEKFFDVVTGTTNASGGATFSHSLGSSPGCIIVKATGTTSNWGVWHRSIPNGSVYLNLTNAQDTSDIRVSSATSTSVTITDTFWLPANQPFVAYLFAHDAGGFGDAGDQNVISCGSYVGDGTSATVNLGWEPQWILIKKSSSAGAVPDWHIYDNMRGIATGGIDPYLRANLSDAEVNAVDNVDVSATGFTAKANIAIASETYIYIAIRRGPMKTPEVGTEVFSPNVQNASSTIALTTGFPVDLIIGAQRSKATFNSTAVFDRLRGTRGVASGGKWLATNSSNSENSDYGQNIDRMDGFLDLFFNTSQGVTSSTAYWSFRRAPGFFDVVCYTGTGVARTVNHNLGVAPELMIVKSRSNSPGWLVYSSAFGPTYWAGLNNEKFYTPATVYWNNTAPTSTVFTVGTSDATNFSAYTYVAYLFATVPGVSKVGSYTGTGTTQQINCGFSSGARFVLIKRTDSTGDWYVWDTARGIVAGNDPYLLLNSTAAEVTNTDYIDTYSAGFEISSTAPAAINANGGSFMFLAIA